MGIESTIADGVKRACERFAAEVRDQGADIEEALTKALLKELEAEFRQVQPRLEVSHFGPAGSSVPILSVRQRPSSKRLEEPKYGCDVAWLLTGTVHGRYQNTWADLVQVKKSSSLQARTDRKAGADTWEIKTKQLRDILEWSATAAYWLIASAGEVLVIPAKHLVALKNGTKRHANAQTFTVGYSEVRSAAIPLHQYLVDLLIGQWIGTSAANVLKFARGEGGKIRPRVVIEVTIALGKNQDRGG